MQVDAKADQEIRERLKAEQVSVVFRQAASKQVLSPLAGVILIAVIWPVGDPVRLTVWLAAMLGMGVVRQIVASRYIRAPEPRDTRKWEIRFMATVSLAAAAWGFGGFVNLVDLPVAYQALIYLFMIGMAGGTTAIYAAHPPSVAFTIMVIMGPTTLYFISTWEPYYLSMAAGGILYHFAAVRGIQLTNAAFHNSFRLAHRLEQIARFDSLSGLVNRLAFTEDGERIVANVRRSGRSCVLLMIDLDHFKSINDKVGHAGGDSVIRQFGALVSATVREGEIAGRLGGEEFAVMLPDANIHHGEALARRILQRIRSNPVQMGDETIAYTASIGVAVCDGHCTLDQLMARADDALYVAKHAGRDRFVLAPYEAKTTAVEAIIA